MVNPMSTDTLASSLILLASGVGAMGLARSFRLSPVIGFFIAGALIGPFGLGLVDPSRGALHALADLGVCFLLFDAGLHISITQLRTRWRSFLTLGTVQLTLVGGLLAGALRLYGYPPSAAFIVGLTLALSSTAIVLKSLHDDGEEDAPVGRTATEILVFQDLVGILLLVVLGSLGGSDEQAAHVVTRTLGNVGLAIFFVAVGSRLLLRPFFRWVTSIKMEEVFILNFLNYCI